jgi:hypothetical protein
VRHRSSQRGAAYRFRGVTLSSSFPPPPFFRFSCATWPLGLLVLFHWVKSMRWTPEGKAKLEFGDINLGITLIWIRF